MPTVYLLTWLFYCQTLCCGSGLLRLWAQKDYCALPAQRMPSYRPRRKGWFSSQFVASGLSGMNLKSCWVFRENSLSVFLSPFKSWLPFLYSWKSILSSLSAIMCKCNSDFILSPGSSLWAPNSLPNHTQIIDPSTEKYCWKLNLTKDFLWKQRKEIFKSTQL